MFDLKISLILLDEKSDKAKTENFAFVFNVNIVYYNVFRYSINLISTKVPEEAEMKSILLGEKNFLGEKKLLDKCVLRLEA